MLCFILFYLCFIRGVKCGYKIATRHKCIQYISVMWSIHLCDGYAGWRWEIERRTRQKVSSKMQHWEQCIITSNNTTTLCSIINIDIENNKCNASFYTKETNRRTFLYEDGKCSHKCKFYWKRKYNILAQKSIAIPNHCLD